MLTFYKRLFYTLSDVFAYEKAFSLGQDRVYIYKDVMKQVGVIFELGSVFASDLVRAIKKNKSWALVFLSEFEVDKLLAPLERHMRTDCIGRKRQEGALKTFNQQ